MTCADTPMPGEDPGALIEDEDRLDEIEPPPEDGRSEPPTPVEEVPGAFDAERQRS